MVLYGAVCCMVLYVVWCCMLYGAVYCVVLYGAVWCCMVLCGAVWCCTVLYIVWCCVLLYGAVVLYIVWCCVLLYGAGAVCCPTAPYACCRSHGWSDQVWSAAGSVLDHQPWESPAKNVLIAEMGDAVAATECSVHAHEGVLLLLQMQLLRLNQCA